MVPHVWVGVGVAVVILWIRATAIVGRLGSGYIGTTSPVDRGFFGLLVLALIWDGVMVAVFAGVILIPLRERNLARLGIATPS